MHPSAFPFAQVETGQTLLGLYTRNIIWRVLVATLRFRPQLLRPEHTNMQQVPMLQRQLQEDPGANL